MKRILIYFFTGYIFTIFLSCKTAAQPVIYDKTLNEARKELRGITLMIQQNAIEDADKRLEQAIILYPKNVDLKTVQCFLLLKKNLDLQAEEMITELLEQMPQNALLYTARAMLKMKRMEWDLAEKDLEKSISLSHSRLAYPWFQKGLLYFRQGNYQDASRCFSRAKMLDFHNPEPFFFYYLCQLYITKDLDDNLHLWKAVKDKTAEIPAWYYPFYAQTLSEIGWKEDASKIIEQGLQSYPNDLYLHLFDCCIRLEKIKENNEVPDSALGEKIRKLLNQLPGPETADTWITWLELSQDLRLPIECRKYITLYSYSPLAQEWSKKMDNRTK